jgi:hypothetical protein
VSDLIIATNVSELDSPDSSNGKGVAEEVSSQELGVVKMPRVADLDNARLELAVIAGVSPLPHDSKVLVGAEIGYNGGGELGGLIGGNLGGNGDGQLYAAATVRPGGGSVELGAGVVAHINPDKGGGMGVGGIAFARNDVGKDNFVGVRITYTTDPMEKLSGTGNGTEFTAVVELGHKFKL